MNPWNNLRLGDMGPEDISDEMLQAMIDEIDAAEPFLRKYDCGAVWRSAMRDRASLVSIQHGRKNYG